MTLTERPDLPKLHDAEENGEPFEYKRVGEDAQNIFNAVKNRIRDAKKQASNIIVYIDRNKYNINEIIDGTKKALFYDKKKKQAKNISILSKEGRIIYEQSID